MSDLRGPTNSDASAAISFGEFSCATLGYQNANCVGCVKGGMGYWNKIRQDFPEIFERTARLERKAGHSCIKGKFLDELDPSAGRFEAIELPECGIYCEVEDFSA